MKDYGEDLFKGTAWYYSRNRPLYSASLIRFLRSKFSLDGNGHMLDLGCGDGRLSLRFSDWFEKIVGIDTEREMIQEAERLSKEFRVEHTEWFIGDIEKYNSTNNTTFRFVTIAKAFHWMNRPKVLDSLYEMIAIGGGIAIIDNYSPKDVLLPWQEKVQEVVKHWYGNERRAGNITYSHPTVSHQDIISSSKFDLEIHQMPSYEQVWTLDSIIGNHYSTSFGAKRFLGDNVDFFEKHLKEELLAIDKTGVFKEQINTSVKLALKNM
ncbi:class I SAM-dependent methyltransferase [Paenisporosarcina sp. FSL H8-0542]|uniref:class I SAM-dependent methyltransferase n=1 Tax=Paenisporosarcina sp. FSL H8-0542 TaxID=2921401 RepID=UPI00315A2754